MKKLLAIFLFLDMFICYAQVFKRFDLSYNTPHGKVKQMKEVCYSYIDRFGELKKELIYTKVMLYDEKGNKYEETKYDANGLIVTKTILIYDNLNNLIEESIYTGDGKIFLKIVCLYDFENRIINVTHYSDKKKVEYLATEKYNEVGNIVEITEYWKWGPERGGDVEQKQYFLYDRDGRVIENKLLSDNKIKTYTSIYDKKGNIMESLEYIDTGKILPNMTYEYNSLNRLEKIHMYENGTLVSRIIYTYKDENINTITWYSIGVNYGKVSEEISQLVEYEYIYF